MTYPAPTSSADSSDSATAVQPTAPAQGWSDVRDDSDIQFGPVEIPDTPPPEPSAFEEAIRALFSGLGEILSPLGSLLVGIWPVLQWVLLFAVIAFVIYLLANLVGPIARSRRAKAATLEEPEWTPDREESIALLEDADRLAAEGKYDEATHLLLQRSVSQIATARPDWVEPSSTARELAALPTLSEAARKAFGTIAERVERSLFALRSLDKSDWDAARAAYADFALVRIGAGS